MVGLTGSKLQTSRFIELQYFVFNKPFILEKLVSMKTIENVAVSCDGFVAVLCQSDSHIT
jgi:hypothetical protein